MEPTGAEGRRQTPIELVIHDALQIAVQQNHEYMSLEHLAIALLTDPVVAQSVKSCGADPKTLTNSLYDIISKFDTIMPMHQGMTGPRPTQTFEAVVRRAHQQAAAAGRQMVEPFHVVGSLLQENESLAAYVFIENGIDRIKFLQAAHSYQTNPGTNPNDVAIDPATGMPKLSAKDALKEYCVNLNEKATKGDIDSLIGRHEEVEKTITVLCRRRKNNPLFVGDPGVGKTAIAEGLARRIVEKQVPPYLQDAMIFSLEMGTLVAGAKFRGDVEERLKMVLEGIKEVNKEHKAILFIDEIHTMIGAGAVGGGSLDVGNLLKPALQKGELRCIGSTTYDEYNKHFRKDAALRRRFAKIDIVEPTIDETKAILKGLAPVYNEYHGIELTDEVIEAAVDLAARYIHENKMPDKAIDVIDTAGARLRLLEEIDGDNTRKVLTIDDIEQTVAKIARIPEVNQDSRLQLAKLSGDLKTFVFGQDEALDALTRSIKLSYAGLREADKPVGSYLFSGPTGVGKTEVAKTLARTLGVELTRIDMSEYMEKHTVSRLIGSPPGYVGHDDSDGILIEAVDKHPHSVLLLDEIEKAHPDVFNILLQIMDGARLTSSRGKTVNFRNVVLIMTTNAGAADLQKKAIGFGRENIVGADEEAIKKLFTPEFRNRLDAIIAFKALSMETMENIVQKFINQLQVQLDEKNVLIDITPQALKWLAKKGYDPLFGARPLARVIQDQTFRGIALW